MSNPFRPPSFLSPMNYSRATMILGLALIILGTIGLFGGGSVALAGIGALLLIMSGMMNDIQRNFVGLILLTKAEEAGDNVLEEFDTRIETLEARVNDLSDQHNPIVNEIETVQAEIAQLKAAVERQRNLLNDTRPGFFPLHTCEP